MTTTSKTKPTPPEAAVAADAHWAKKMARLRNRELAEATLCLCDDQDVRDLYHDTLRRKVTAENYVRLHPDDTEAATQAKEAAAEHERAAGLYEEASILLRFRALPRPALDALMKAHEATEEQREDGHDQNPDTWPAALISAASVDGMSEDDAKELCDTWSAQEAAALFNAAFTIQQHSRGDLGKG